MTLKATPDEPVPVEVAERRRSRVPEITYPASLPPVRRVVLGRDGTVWLELQDNAASHRWIVLDGGEEQLGAVELPSNVTLRTADRSRLWTLERDADDLESIVVYRLELGS